MLFLLPTVEQSQYHIEVLKNELARRIASNPRYSMRAFSKALNIDVAFLSRALAQKKSLSIRTAQKILETLDLTPHESYKFLKSVASQYSSVRLKKLNLPNESSMDDYQQIPPEVFAVVSDWYHYAILELTFAKGFKSDPRWIANRLGISFVEANQAIDRLVQLGLLAKKGGTLSKTSKNIEIKDKSITSSAHKKLQKQVLEKAVHSLENDPIEKRSMTSMTFAIDPKKLPLAKKLIDDFTREITALLETGKERKVYHLGVSLYPIEKET